MIQCAYPWKELSIIVNKSRQSFPRTKSSVSPRVRTNQSQFSLMTLIILGTQLLLLVVMSLSICDSWCSYHQDLETNCSSFQFLFLKFGVSLNSTLKWFYGSLVFKFLRTCLFWSIEKVFFLGCQVFVFLWDEFPRCSFKLWSFYFYTPRDPHELISHWLLIRPIVIQCACP